ncbi:MAG: hypothetical protein OHK0039_23460 [Bacteroidia bacterium]
MPEPIAIYLRTAFQEWASFSIPGVGTFWRQHVPARVDARLGRVGPPMERWELAAGVVPGLDLAQQLHQRLLLGEQAAQAVAAALSRHLCQVLEAEGQVALPGAGMLRRDGAGELVLETHPDESPTDTFFGLREVRYPVFVSSVLSLSDNVESMTQTDPKPSFVSTIWKSALLVLLLSAMGYTLLTQGPFTKRRSSLAQGLQVRFEAPTDDALAVSDQPATPPVETVQPADQPLLPATQPETDPTNARLADPGQARGLVGEDIADEDSFRGTVNISVLDTSDQPAKPLPNQRTRSLEPQQRQFHIIAGSFKDQASAEQAVAKLKQKGLDAIILFPAQTSSNSYRISVYRAADRQEVAAQGDRFKRLGKIESFWIYEWLP